MIWSWFDYYENLACFILTCMYFPRLVFFNFPSLSRSSPSLQSVRANHCLIWKPVDSLQDRSSSVLSWSVPVVCASWYQFRVYIAGVRSRNRNSISCLQACLHWEGYKGYKDGLQPESLADGNWLVKQNQQGLQNQPVSKIETKSDTNLRSLYESWFRSALISKSVMWQVRKEEIQSSKEQTHAES